MTFGLTNADEAELFVNGVSQGVKQKSDSVFHVSWRTTYEPGEIKVVTRKDGKEVMSRETKTAGEPYQIKLTPDRSQISANRDLSFITVEILDKDGNLCPNADNLVNFEIEGGGKIAGVDNGNPVSMESFKAPMRKAFYGKCLVIVESNKTGTPIQLKATSGGLNGDEVKITVK